jgi:DNA invertase Pin-like site-specific DNA recombinase
VNRPGTARLLALVDAGEVQTVIIAKLDRLTRSVKDLCTLLERFDRRGVALVSVGISLNRFFARRDHGHQFHVRLEVNQKCESFAKEGVVIHCQDPNLACLHPFDRKIG